MVSLGVSAISDTWTSFGQNIKVVEAYQQAVSEGQFPIFKGHILNEEDLVIRKHILRIMCAGETEWEGDQLVYPAIAHGLMRCEEVETDGLLEIFPDKIKVTELGKAFLRNICMCFDTYYQTKTDVKNMFSTAV